MSWLTETVLVAFVDGELDPVVGRRIAAALESDLEARETVELLRRSSRLVKKAIERQDVGDVPEEILAYVRGSASERPKWARFARPMAVSVLLATVGFGGGWTANRFVSDSTPTFSERLVEELADYHRIYAAQTAHQVELRASERAEIERWFSNVLHRRLTIPDLAAAGWTFEGARLLVVEGRPVAELVYAVPERPHQPLALCISFGDDGVEAFRTENRADLIFGVWRQHGYTYVVAGWLTPDILDSLIARVRRELDAI
jgi:anti-sigma factor RsiW